MWQRETRERQGEREKKPNLCFPFFFRQWQLSLLIFRFFQSEETKEKRRLSLFQRLFCSSEMRQSTLSFLLVPKVEAAEDREDDEDEDDAVEVSSGDDDDERRKIEAAATAPALLPPLKHLNDNAPPQHARGTWSIPHHLKSRQIGRSGPRAKRPMAQPSSSPSAPASRRRPSSFTSTSTSATASTSFSTPARHRAAAASAAARSLRTANASLPLVMETVVASEAAFPAATSGAETTAAAATTTASTTLVRRRDWRVSDLRFDGRTGELLAVALRGPGDFSTSSASGPGALQHQGELQLFSDSSLRSSLSACRFPTFRRRRRRRAEEEEGGGDEDEEGEEDEGDDDDEEEEDEPSDRGERELLPLASARFPDGPLLELAWDCSSGGSDVVAALVGGSRLSGGGIASSSSSFSSAASGSRRYPSGALALFDLDDEAIFCTSSGGEGESASRRCATAVIEPSTSSSLSSSSSTLAFRSAAVSLATAAPAWTALCPNTVRSAFAVGNAAGKVHLWDRRASLTRPVGMLSSGAVTSFSSSAAAAATAAEGGGGGGSNSSSAAASSSLRSLALLADGQTLVGGCSDGTLRLWDVRACLGGGSKGGVKRGDVRGGAGVVGGGRAGVISLGGGGGGGISLASSARFNDACNTSASHVGGALPAAMGCLRAAVRAVPGVEALLAGTPENDFADAVALGGVSLLCAHPTDAARVAFRLDCGWNGAYVVGGRVDKEGFGCGDGVGAVSHLHAPPVVAVGGERAASSFSSSSSTDASRLLLLRGGAWGSASSPASFVVTGTSSSSESSVAATLAVVDCLNAGSAAAAGSNGEDENADPAAPPFPSAVHIPVPSGKAATAVAVHRASGEVVVGTEDGCLAWFDGSL